MEEYEVIKLLGKGAYGRALLCRELGLDRLVVIKQVTSLSEEQLLEARREAEILAGLEHPNVVRFYGSFLEASSLEGNCLHIAMEYCDSGDLDCSIKRRKRLGRAFEELHVMRIFVQVTLALVYIHARRILHRDIKPQNVFLTSDGCVKLGDFGVAKSLGHSGNMAQTQLGTPYYLSPEIFNDETYDSSSDIWSLGVLTFELATLALPFQAGSLGKLAVRVMRDEPAAIPEGCCSPDLRDLLLKSLLTKKAADRPSAQAVLKIPFVRDHAKRLLEHAEATGYGGLEEEDDEDEEQHHAAPSENSAPIDDNNKSTVVVEENMTFKPMTTTIIPPKEEEEEETVAMITGDGADLSHEHPLDAPKEEGPMLSARSTKSNPFARENNPTGRLILPRRPGLPATLEEDNAAVAIQRSWRSGRDVLDRRSLDDDVGANKNSNAAAQMIQRSWRNLNDIGGTVPRPRRRPPSGSSAEAQKPARAKTAKNSRQSVRESLAKAAERGAAKKKKAEQKEKAQRLQRAAERGEDTLVLQQEEDDASLVLEDRASFVSPTSHSTTFSEDNSPLGLTLGRYDEEQRPSADWRVREQITIAAQRGLTRKAHAEERAAKNQRDLDDLHGFSRVVGARSPMETTLSPQRRSSRKHDDESRWVPKLESLAASTFGGLDDDNNDDSVPAAAGPAGRAVSAARNARAPPKSARVGNKTPRDPRYRTKSSSKALQNSLASLLRET